MDKIVVDIKYCNNIGNGQITIEKDMLNIKYGMNGTGKSTISTALELLGKKQSLEPLRPFWLSEKEHPSITTSEELGNVLVFNEEFVDTLVFQESAVIKDAFDVFIKTPDYDVRRASLDTRLKTLKIDIGQDANIMQLRSDIQELTGKLELTTAGNALKINQNLKSILKKDNLFNIPTSLKKYGPLLSDDLLSISWIDWKTKGEPFDEKGICPFCSDELKSPYVEEKAVFKDTYKKADSQNLKNMLDLFVLFEKYLVPEKHSALMECIKTDVAKDKIKTLLTAFMVEFIHIKVQLEKINQFDACIFRDVDIKDLDKLVSSLKIEKTILNFFNSSIILEIVDFLNNKVNQLGEEIVALKTDMGTLRSVMQTAIKTSLKDMNTFLQSAGIQYEVDISMDNDGKTMARLQYRKDDTTYTVDTIRKHLSWGERNAFALVLFMFYAQSQNPNLIVLDDPISSFDSNKKYAIIHRLFSKVRNEVSRSFYKKTVLMLTHDFEPIIDFVVVGKLPKECISATFIKNTNDNLSEMPIDKDVDIKSVIQELLMHIRNNDLNMIHRITFLRKYYEHHGIGENMNAYDVLSSLIHGRSLATSKDETPLSDVSLLEGITEIKDFFNDVDFDYSALISDYFNEAKLVDFYFLETNAYLKLQIFRALLEVVPLPEIENNDTLIKFINESYHIENDYAYYLDVLKFDMVPSYIIKSVDTFMNQRHLKHTSYNVPLQTKLK